MVNLKEFYGDLNDKINSAKYKTQLEVYKRRSKSYTYSIHNNSLVSQKQKDQASRSHKLIVKRITNKMRSVK